MNKKNIHTLKRTVIGLLMMTVVSLVLSFVPPLFESSNDPGHFFLSKLLPAVEQSLKVAVAAFAGAYYARVPFVLAAVAYFAGMTLYRFYVLVRVAEPEQPVSIFQVIAMNWIDTVSGLVAAFIGAVLGFYFSKRETYSLMDSF